MGPGPRTRPRATSVSPMARVESCDVRAGAHYWQNDNTLKLEFDAGTQTSLFTLARRNGMAEDGKVFQSPVGMCPAPS